MHIPEHYEFFNKTKICSGKKALENIPFDLRSMDAAKPLVITDAMTVKYGFVNILKKSFYDSGMIIGAVYDQVDKLATTSIVKKIATLYRDRGCDSIIAVGGSSSVAVAKGLNIIVSNKTDDLLSFQDMSKSAPLHPFIYIPTSGALGTEITNEVIIDARVYKSFDLMPDIAVIDPRMIGKNDVNHILNAGLLALTQAVEACAFEESNPINDSFAYASIDLVFNNILPALEGRSKRDERTSFINGVVISGIVYSNASKGLARAMGFEIEKMTGNSAGLCAGMILPYLLDYKLSNMKSGIRGELLLPLAGIDKYCSIPEKERPETGVKSLFELLARLGRVIPGNLKSMNIPEYMIKNIAAEVEGRAGKLFPAGTALTVLEHAYHGKKFSGGK